MSQFVKSSTIAHSERERREKFCQNCLHLFQSYSLEANCFGVYGLMPSEIKPKQKSSCQGIKKMQNQPGYGLHAHKNELAGGFIMILVSNEPSLEGCSSWRAPQGPAHGPELHHICVEGNSIWSLWKTLWLKRRLRE